MHQVDCYVNDSERPRITSYVINEPVVGPPFGTVSIGPLKLYIDPGCAAELIKHLEPIAALAKEPKPTEAKS